MLNSLRSARIKARSARTINAAKARENDELKRWLTFNGIGEWNWVSTSIDPATRVFQIELDEGFIVGGDPAPDENAPPKVWRQYGQSLAEDTRPRMDKKAIEAWFKSKLGEKNIYKVVYSSYGRRLEDSDENEYGRARGAGSGNVVLVEGMLPKGARSIRAIDFDDDGNEKSFKMFNLLWVNEQLGAIMSELANEAKREPEIAAALSCMLAAKQLFSAYEERIGGAPFKTSDNASEKASNETPLSGQLRGFANQINLTRNDVNNDFMVEIEDVLDTGDFPQTRSVERLLIDIQKIIINWRNGNERARQVQEKDLVDQLVALAEQIELEGVQDNRGDYRRSIRSRDVKKKIMRTKRAPGSRRTDVKLADTFRIPPAGDREVNVKVGDINVVLKPPKGGWEAFVPQGEHRTAEFWVEVKLPNGIDETLFMIRRADTGDDKGKACVIAYNQWIQWHNEDEPIEAGDTVEIYPRARQKPHPMEGVFD